MMLFIHISVCLEAHAVPDWGVSPGITACLARECPQASAGVNGLMKQNISTAVRKITRPRVR